MFYFITKGMQNVCQGCPPVAPTPITTLSHPQSPSTATPAAPDRHWLPPQFFDRCRCLGQRLAQQTADFGRYQQIFLDPDAAEMPESLQFVVVDKIGIFPFRPPAVH